MQIVNYNYDTHYRLYQNIKIYAEEWRKFTTEDSNMDKKEFQNKLQFNKYIQLNYFNQNTNKKVIIFLLPIDSIIATKSQEMKKILSSVMDISDIIIISESPLKSHLQKAVKSFKRFNIKKYIHDNFSIVIPNAAISSKHEILTKDEVTNLLNKDLYCNIQNLPKIDINDPQCIWLGAELGDVLRITSDSNISGKYIHYRLVISNSNFINERQKDISADDDVLDTIDEVDDDDDLDTIDAAEEGSDEDASEEIDNTDGEDTDIDDDDIDDDKN